MGSPLSQSSIALFGANDKRIGQVAYPGVTDQSGLKPGFLVGQQVDEKRK
jgi:hypothetical protein